LENKIQSAGDPRSSQSLRVATSSCRRHRPGPDQQNCYAQAVRAGGPGKV